MRRIRFILAGIATLLLASCAEEQLVPSSEHTQGEVMITLSAEDGTNDISATKAEAQTKAPQTALPDIGDFEVEIYSLSSGWRLYRDTYANTLGSRIPLNAGEYRLLAQHGDSLSIGFNSIWYSADTQFTVHGQTVEEISAVAKMNKVKVAIKYGTNLQLKYDQYHSRVRLDGLSDRYLRYEKSETRAGYFPAGSIGYEFYAEVDGTLMYWPAEPVECAPNDFITFHVDLDLGTGNLNVLTIKTDGTMEEVVSDQTVPAQYGPKDLPEVTLSGFDENDNYAFVEAYGAELAQADLIAKAGIKSCVLEIQSDYLSAMGVPASVDLASETLDPTVKQALRSVGMRWPRNMAGARFANVDFTALPDELKYNPANNFSGTFTITVTDILDRTAQRTFTISCAEPSTPVLTASAANAFAKRFRGLTAGIEGANSEKLAIQYSTDGTNWTTVSPESVSGQTTAYADITGLTSATVYYLRAIYNDNENVVSETVTLTTETELQVGNPGFEDWYRQQTYSQSVLWARNTMYRYFFWPESASEDARWWDTVNELTTPNPGGSSVWDYRSAPGTVPTSDEGETASGHLRSYDGQSSLVTESHNGSNAAEIASVGWGTGNSWTDVAHNASDRTAGQLYIGTYSNGAPDYGKAFASRPSAVTFWYKYYSYQSESTSPYVEVYAADGTVIGSGRMTIGSTVNSFTQARIDIDYPVLATAGEITIVFKSTDSESPATKDVQGSSGAMSGYLDSRHIGSILTVDDVELIYE